MEASRDHDGLRGSSSDEAHPLAWGHRVVSSCLQLSPVVCGCLVVSTSYRDWVVAAASSSQLPAPGWAEADWGPLALALVLCCHHAMPLLTLALGRCHAWSGGLYYKIDNAPTPWTIFMPP